MNKTQAQKPSMPLAERPPSSTLLSTKPVVINVGLETFATELAAQGVTVTQVDWSPPAGGDARLAALLAKLGT